MKEIKVELTFTEDCLGTSSANEELYSTYIASNAPDAKSRQEEIEAIGAEEYENKQKTVFPRDENGNPFFWDYQIKGFLKEACGTLQRCKGEDFAKESCKIKAYKKIIDGVIFVKDRKIPIELSGPVKDNQRPLRAQTAQGERVALANSESIPAGSKIRFSVVTLSDQYDKAIIEWLNYGSWRGIGQWRNASWGRFSYTYTEG